VRGEAVHDISARAQRQPSMRAGRAARQSMMHDMRKERQVRRADWYEAAAGA